MVQSPFYPEGAVCHLYVLHPPGGVVAGDSLGITVRVRERAHALLTTPAATKIYRSNGQRACIDQELEVAPGATLEWLPQDTLAFAGARAHIRTRVRLCDSARFIGWEAMCLGRPASGERFEHGAIRQDVELWKDEEPLLIERNACDADSALMKSHWGLANRCVLASMLLYPAEEHLLTAVRSLLGRFDASMAAVTEVDGVLVCRIIGDDMSMVRKLLVATWRTLRPKFLGLEPSAPRIWAT
ncbi:MAG: urease accessory protein UreD [Gammaproteobacteria bacterium]|nr:urease accessory protein UreD [Gammaproteobacteria bacterium]